MTLHREGTKIIINTLIIIAIINIPSWLFLSEIWFVSEIISAISLIMLGLILWFFRYPSRDLPKRDNIMCCPADGKVVAIEEVYEPEYFKEKRKLVCIFMSPLNVHANFYPMAGEVKYFKHHHGKYLVAWHPKSSTENERTTIVVENINGVNVLVRQIAGAVARRIVSYAKVGEKVEQAGELGFIKFGSRLDVYLPLDSKVLVELDQKTTGGITPLAEI